MALIVQKYGGTSVGTLDRIRNVAARLKRTHDAGNQVVAVVSAMSGVTDGLIKMARELTDNPPERELDVLLATGEQPANKDGEVQDFQLLEASEIARLIASGQFTPDAAAAISQGLLTRG